MCGRRFLVPDYPGRCYPVPLFAPRDPSGVSTEQIYICYTRICTAVIQNKKKPSPSPHFKIIRTICFLSHPLRLNPRSVLPRPASDTGGGAPRSGDGVSRSGVGGLRSGGAACGGGRYRGQRCCRSADRPPPPHTAVPPAAAVHVHRLPRALQHGAGNL